MGFETSQLRGPSKGIELPYTDENRQDTGWGMPIRPLQNLDEAAVVDLLRPLEGEGAADTENMPRWSSTIVFSDGGEPWLAFGMQLRAVVPQDAELLTNVFAPQPASITFEVEADGRISVPGKTFVLEAYPEQVSKDLLGKSIETWMALIKRNPEIAIEIGGLQYVYTPRYGLKYRPIFPFNLIYSQSNRVRRFDGLIIDLSNIGARLSGAESGTMQAHHFVLPPSLPLLQEIAVTASLEDG